MRSVLPARRVTEEIYHRSGMMFVAINLLGRESDSRGEFDLKHPHSSRPRVNIGLPAVEQIKSDAVANSASHPALK